MDIEKMAREAGLGPIMGSLKDGDDVWIDCDVEGGLEKFAELVASELRKAQAIHPVDDRFLTWPGKERSNPKPPIIWLDGIAYYRSARPIDS